MVEIRHFLTARLDEDEESARKASALSSPRWIDNGSLLMYLDDSPTPFAEALASVENYRQDDALVHIARHDPARVLREVAAKRQIMEFAAEVEGLAETVFQEFSNYPEADGESLLKLLALTYSDHPDYNPDWSTT